MPAILKMHLLFLVSLLFSATTVIAQKSWDFQWGQPYEPEFSGRIAGIVHTDEQGYYALRHWEPKKPADNKPHKASLEFYDNNLNYVRSAQIDLEHKGQSLSFEALLSMSAGHLLLSSHYNWKQQKHYLYSRPVNVPTLKSEDEFVQVMQINVRSDLWRAYFRSRLSADSSKVLVFGSESDQQGKQEQFHLAVMDTNRKMLWTKKAELPYPEKDVEVIDYAVDNQGNAYILASRNRTRKEKETGRERDTDFYIFAYLSGGALVREYKASLEEKYITNLGFQMQNNGHLQCAGFYSTEEEGQVKGVFSYTLDGATGTEQNKNFQPFSTDILISDLSKRKQEKVKSGKSESDRELEGYILRSITPQSDSGILLIGEKFYITQSTSPSGMSYNSVAHYDDLLVVKLSAERQIVWACKLDKAQVNTGTYYSIPVADHYYFMYENGAVRKNTGQIATISPDGKVTYTDFEKAGDDTEAGSVLAPGTLSMIVWSDANSMTRVGKIKFR